MSETPIPVAPPAAAARVRFTDDFDFTPDGRTVAFVSGMDLDANSLFELFAVDSLDELREALTVRGVPAEIVGA